MQDQRLARCLTWLAYSPIWRTALFVLGLGLISALSVIFLLVGGLDVQASASLTDRLSVAPTLIFAISYSLGLCTVLLADRALLLKIKSPLRESSTQSLIDASMRASNFSHQAIAQELVIRAQHKDCKARGFLLGRPRHHAPDLTGIEIARKLPWGDWFPRVPPRAVWTWLEKSGLKKIQDDGFAKRRLCRIAAVALLPVGFAAYELSEDFEAYNRTLDQAFEILGLALLDRDRDSLERFSPK